MTNQKWAVIEYDLQGTKVDESIWKEVELRDGGLSNFEQTSPVSVVNWVYQNRGYDSIRTEPLPHKFSFSQTIGGNPTVSNELYNQIEDMLQEHIDSDQDQSCEQLGRAGLPDLIVFDQSDEKYGLYEKKRSELNDFRFIEVKSKQDSLQHSQIDWITRYGFLPIRLAYVLPAEDWDDESYF